MTLAEGTLIIWRHHCEHKAINEYTPSLIFSKSRRCLIISSIPTQCTCCVILRKLLSGLQVKLKQAPWSADWLNASRTLHQQGRRGPPLTNCCIWASSAPTRRHAFSLLSLSDRPETKNRKRQRIQSSDTRQTENSRPTESMSPK
jgi:hypothetical protein